MVDCSGGCFRRIDSEYIEYITIGWSTNVAPLLSACAENSKNHRAVALTNQPLWSVGRHVPDQNLRHYQRR